MKVVWLFVALLVAAAVADDDFRLPLKSEKARYLFGSYKTTTYTAVVQSTSSVFFSCLSGTYSTTICMGRKKKSFQKIEPLDAHDQTPLEPSGDVGVEDAKVESDSSRNERVLGFTVWTTAKTTTTVTVLYTNSASTIKLSYYCAAGGINFPLIRC